MTRFKPKEMNGLFTKKKLVWINFEEGATFDNSFFDNCFDLVRQLMNRSFLGPFSVHKVEFSISRTNSGQQLCLIIVLFDFFPA